MLDLSLGLGRGLTCCTRIVQSDPSFSSILIMELNDGSVDACLLFF